MIAQGKRRSSVGTKLLVAVLVAGFLALFVIPLGIGFYQGFTSGSHRHRGIRAARALAVHIESCGVPLPPSSQPVPTTLPGSSGVSSGPGDFRQFTCRGNSFSLSELQYHRLEWEKGIGEQGRVIAEADLDGDGAIDHRVEVHVICIDGPCSLSEPLEERLGASR